MSKKTLFLILAIILVFGLGLSLLFVSQRLAQKEKKVTPEKAAAAEYECSQCCYHEPGCYGTTIKQCSGNCGAGTSCSGDCGGPYNKTCQPGCSCVNSKCTGTIGGGSCESGCQCQNGQCVGQIEVPNCGGQDLCRTNCKLRKVGSCPAKNDNGWDFVESRDCQDPSCEEAPPTTPPPQPPGCWEQCSQSNPCPQGSGYVCQDVQGVNRCVNPQCTDKQDCTCPPPSVACQDLSSDPGTTGLSKGDTISLSCQGTGTGSLLHHFKYRVKIKKTGDADWGSWQPIGQRPKADPGIDYEIPETGEYVIQCQACNEASSQCTEWGKAN
jgi:hypothetical protein